jgi:hypothetical protein
MGDYIIKTTEAPSVTTETTVKKFRQTTFFRIVVVAVAVVVIIILVQLFGGRAQFHTKVTEISVIDPQTVSVSFEITNSGQASGTPWCSVTVKSPNSAYQGSDYFLVANPIYAGQTSSLADSVDVSAQGAQFITSAKVSC